MQVRHVFVYGTLMKGLSNHQVIQPFIKSIEQASLQGQLFHLPYGYPAMMSGEGVVFGELVELDGPEEALVALDQLEDYYGAGNPNNLYNRVLREVEVANGQGVMAYVYLWANPEELPEMGVRVVSGNWRNFMGMN